MPLGGALRVLPAQSTAPHQPQDHAPDPRLSPAAPPSENREQESVPRQALWHFKRGLDDLPARPQLPDAPQMADTELH